MKLLYWICHRCLGTGVEPSTITQTGADPCKACNGQGRKP